ncbi:hypothetical protein LPJ53_006149 [Coemansia erecta]|uniref:lytic cellulose monooxygenase (C4-dehydrogenating) n=1 Tax=Coemansia erecta TaxID=147472 RepID=A0A9W8CPM8_9FUNG|nr:hypothetical protein LPJ53_006149 [Coemansia erecta]
MKSGLHIASAFAFAAYAALSVNAQAYLAALTKYGESKPSDSKTVLPYYNIPNMPVTDPDSEDLRCRTSDITADITVVQAAANDTLFAYFEGKTPITTFDTPQDINGPCLVYMAPYDQGGEDGWFKIFGMGYSTSSYTWCTDSIRDQGGFRFTIPSFVPAGKYYLRTEVIGLGQSTKTSWDDYTMGAQFFNNCGVVQITEGGDSLPDDTYSIPSNDIYSKTDKGLVGQFGGVLSSYKIPGPAQATDPGSGSGTSSSNKSSKSKNNSSNED